MMWLLAIARNRVTLRAVNVVRRRRRVHWRRRGRPRWRNSCGDLLRVLQLERELAVLLLGEHSIDLLLPITMNRPCIRLRVCARRRRRTCGGSGGARRHLPAARRKVVFRLLHRPPCRVRRNRDVVRKELGTDGLEDCEADRHVVNAVCVESASGRWTDATRRSRTMTRVCFVNGCNSCYSELRRAHVARAREQSAMHA